MNANATYKSLLTPSETLVQYITALRGDIMILGAGGKMGPSLARLAQQAIREAGVSKTVSAVARFSDDKLEAALNQEGIITTKADLLDDLQLQGLPHAENILYLAGTKFGTSGNEPQTWAMNTYLPGRVAEKFRNSRIVVFSTGNVYPLVPAESRGATEQTKPEPLGEYAQSCLGRERMFQYFSTQNQTPALIYRLNYANDVTYGVLSDIAMAVKSGNPIDLRMGYVNIIWQQDANEIAIRSLDHCTIPPKVLNVTGPDRLSVRQVANLFGGMFDKEPMFIHQESETALLSDASESVQLFGTPRVSPERMIQLIGAWIAEGGKTLDKPTHFQERKGNF